MADLKRGFRKDIILVGLFTLFFSIDSLMIPIYQYKVLSSKSPQVTTGPGDISNHYKEGDKHEKYTGPWIFIQDEFQKTELVAFEPIPKTK